MSITTAGRSLSANMVTEVSASQLSPVLLASFSFSTPVRLWSGYGTITVGAVTYQGIEIGRASCRERVYVQV
jgi:hypothetical protein